MKRAGSGRVARKIGAYDDEAADSGSGSQSEAQNQPGMFPRASLLQAPVSDSHRRTVLTGNLAAVVKRPVFGKGKKRSSLRMSFGRTESDANDADESSDAAVITPKKSNLSRIAIETSAQLRARSPLVPEVEDRPSYSKDHLAELRNSTPTTPKDLVSSAAAENESRALDIASKFGPNATFSLKPEMSAIPTKAEIEEKKARRKRLAKERSALDEGEDRPWASDDEGEDDFRRNRNEISLRPKDDKWGETRLIHEDEDIAEGFDDFVEDGKIALGRKSEREAQQKRRAEMADLINDAEGGSDEDSSDDSEEDRNAAFAAAQSRAGQYGAKDKKVDDGARTPPRITPLPDIGEILQGLQDDISAKEQRQAMIRRRIEELKEEKVRTAERKQYLQAQLQQTARRFEEMRVEAGKPALPPNGTAGSRLLTERGLDSLGTTPQATSSASDEE
jgi:hypothetical protein